MQRLTLFLLSAVLAVALAGGQYYVPRAYYTIDAGGHASAPVPLRRLRRSPNFYPYPNNNANANSVATASDGGSASATSNANAGGYPSYPYPAHPAPPARGGWSLGGNYGSAKPQGMSRRLAGAVQDARSLSASATVDVNSQGQSYYDTSVNY